MVAVRQQPAGPQSLGLSPVNRDLVITADTVRYIAAEERPLEAPPAVSTTSRVDPTRYRSRPAPSASGLSPAEQPCCSGWID